MRILRITVCVLFALVLCAYVAMNIILLFADDSKPVITVDSDSITVPLNAAETDLLRGVTAYDEKDGDLTDKIVVESISRFAQPGVSIVRYAVCDNDKHVSVATRKVIYEHYSSPKITLSSSLVFPLAQTVNIRNIVGAVDLIDGDVSDKVIISADDYSTKTSGVYRINARFTNSKGDSVSLDLPVYVEDLSIAAPEIKLKDYIAYTKAGQYYSPADNLVTAFAADGTDLTASVDVQTDLNPVVPGIYEIHYRVSDALGRQGHVMTLVVVSE